MDASRIIATLLILISFTARRTSAAEPAIDFERQVRPLLRERCAACHGPKVQKSALRLDAKSFALAGGAGGPVIVAGKSDESELFRRISSDDPDEVMPPKGERLTADEIAIVRRWIDAGAIWPETDADRAAARDKRLDHWAWQPIKRPVVPQVNDSSHRVRNVIDAFVVAKLAAQGLALSAEADRRTLIRRLTYDLIGLPPTPEEVDAFVNDPDAAAYQKLVDRLLASPHYGERWARHWLDIAHYADTHGFERDQRRDNAWRYRDYVIRSLNADKPYNQFISEQIAGDVLRPADSEAVIATGFLAAGPWDVVGQVETVSDVLRRAARADDLDDMVTQVMAAACGITINCARCHDHKLDPISQREYYALWSVFAGVKRGDRVVSVDEQRQYDARKQALLAEQQQVRAQLAELRGAHYDLADIVGGGNGLGTGKRGGGIDPLTGKAIVEPRGFLDNVRPNQFVRSDVRFVDGVVVPDGNVDGVPVSSSGLLIKDLPKTSGQVWDAIRNGPVNSQFSTRLGDLDVTSSDHTLLSLHANAAITFDLTALREAGAPAALKFTAKAGYFGQTPKNGASFYVYVDGVLVLNRLSIGRDDSPIAIEAMLPSSARFLTLVATDGGNGIGHDQIGFVDPWLQPAEALPESAQQVARRDDLQRRLSEIDKALATLPAAQQVFAVKAEAAANVHLLRRGNPEDPLEEVPPGTVACLGLPSSLGAGTASEGERRLALAKWIVDPANPLTRRVIVNRLWHYHFGSGIVDTPSDFGFGGGLPTHPELLDWLAEELSARGWSLKEMHRLICTSATYCQASRGNATAAAIDANNRLLWRMAPCRLEAEAVRDAMLAVSGSLNGEMFGPGYRDFKYQEEYAPVYRYVTPDAPALWRRSIYRFIVRTTPQTLLTTLDCPNPANLTPARNVTTTALQSLALLNNDFVLRQAGHFAKRLEQEAAGDVAAQVRRGFALALSRQPSAQESEAAANLVHAHGLKQFCRMLLNTNEFVVID